MAIKVGNQYGIGWKVATIRDIYVEYDVPTQQYGERDFIWFEFELANGKLLKRRYGFTLHPTGYLYPLAKGFFGTVHSEVDFEELIGTSWEIFLDQKPGANNANWINVTNVRPVEDVFAGNL